MNEGTVLHGNERIEDGQLVQRLAPTTVHRHVVHHGEHLLDGARRALPEVGQHMTILLHDLIGSETRVEEKTRYATTFCIIRFRI